MRAVFKVILHVRSHFGELSLVLGKGLCGGNGAGTDLRDLLREV